MQDNVTQAENTDREIWREREDDYYADSIHVTQQGGIGINCGGHVIQMPVRDWHRLASTTAQTEAVQKLAEALEKLERANEQLCAKRSAKTYDAMIHRDGCHDELIALDDARCAARAALAAHRESQP